MNLKVLQLLLRHRDVLMKVVEAAKRFPQDGSYLAKWKVVDEIAELVIPILEQELDAPKLMASDIEDYLDARQYDAKILAAGAECGVLGIDWKLLVEVIIPIVISILEAVIGRK